tara:strand:- start:5930 stop:6442 length:513 start_codon:yes stop_codon:yes gene_type:complete
VGSLDDIKQLLDGTLDPEALEDNLELYEMAESIYGRDALEHMGVEAPERPTESIVQPNGDAKHEVQMPTMPMPPAEPKVDVRKSRSWRIFIFTFIVTSIILTNIFLGFGSFLPICDSPDSQTICEDKLILSEIADYQSPSSWTQVMEFEIFDIAILVTLLLVMLISLRKK